MPSSARIVAKLSSNAESRVSAKLSQHSQQDQTTSLSRRSSSQRRSSTTLSIHVSGEGFTQTVSEHKCRPLRTHITATSEHELNKPSLGHLAELKRPITSPAVTMSSGPSRLSTPAATGSARRSKTPGKKSKKKKSKRTKLPKLKPKGRQEKQKTTNILSLRPQPCLPSIVELKYPEKDVHSNDEPSLKIDHKVHLDPASFHHSDSSFITYRCENYQFMVAMAAEACCGKPLEHYLISKKDTAGVQMLHFWQDSQAYISLKLAQSGCLDYYQFRQARLLILRHLQADFAEGSFPLGLPVDMCRLLQKLLPLGKGDEFLLSAQDIVSQVKTYPYLLYYCMIEFISSTD